MEHLMYRKNNRGSWRIKRSLGWIAGVEIGKIDVPLGTKDSEVAAEIERVICNDLTQLHEHGAQLLMDLKHKRRTGLQLLDLVRKQKVREVAVILNVESLKDAWTRLLTTGWHKSSGRLIGKNTACGYGQYLKNLLELSPNATVGDLPRLLERYKEVNQGEKVSTVRKVKQACLSFARNTQLKGQSSDLWQRIKEVKVQDAVPSKMNRALRVYEVRELIAAIPNPRIRNLCWGMAMTGTHMKEYLTLTVNADHVHIEGTKDAGEQGNRSRDVPKLIEEFQLEAASHHEQGTGTLTNNVPGARITYKTINNSVKVASGGTATTNIFRHSYRMWLTNSGIPEWRQYDYFGHVGRRDEKVGRQYAKSDWKTFMQEDTERLLTYIKGEWERPKSTERKIERLKLSA
jgi:hypothetical protein